VSQRNKTTVLGFDQALENFRAAEPDSPGAEAAADKTRSDRPATTTGDGKEPAVAEAPAHPVDAAAPVVAAAPASYELPSEGVYAYKARGRESVSVLGAHHDYPSEIFATVRHLGGCKWEHRNQVIAEHVDTRTLCSEAGRYKQIQQTRDIEFFGQREAPSLSCKPAQVHHSVGDKAGAKTTANCTDGEGTKAVVVRTYTGAETIKVGGRPVDALRIELHSTMSGKTNGTADDRLWIHPQTAMTLRWDRTVDTMATAYGAQVRYVEDASFVLESLDPRS
jgi:hypothetical protein